MYRVCVGYVSGMYRECVETNRVRVCSSKGQLKGIEDPARCAHEKIVRPEGDKKSKLSKLKTKRAVG